MSRASKPSISRKRHRPNRAHQRGKILDLFAGAGGWEEGLRPLGLKALGIELEPWACRTATAAGHTRLQADLSMLDPDSFAPVWGLVGSPPCQAYSTAGKGLGKLDKPLVIACAHRERQPPGMAAGMPRSPISLDCRAVAIRARFASAVGRVGAGPRCP